MNHKTVVFNEAKMNFDGNLDFSVLSSEVVTYSDTTPDQFLERVADAEILVTKEMPVSREQILALPDSVKLICEAGTGYNNLDLDAAREKGITVCNIPAVGDPDGGIAPGTAFEDIPDDWVCPICGLGKDVFVPVEE